MVEHFQKPVIKVVEIIISPILRWRVLCYLCVSCIALIPCASSHCIQTGQGLIVLVWHHVRVLSLRRAFMSRGIWLSGNLVFSASLLLEDRLVHCTWSVNLTLHWLSLFNLRQLVLAWIVCLLWLLLMITSNADPAKQIVIALTWEVKLSAS